MFSVKYQMEYKFITGSLYKWSWNKELKSNLGTPHVFFELKVIFRTSIKIYLKKREIITLKNKNLIETGPDFKQS